MTLPKTVIYDWCASCWETLLDPRDEALAVLRGGVQPPHRLGVDLRDHARCCRCGIVLITYMSTAPADHVCPGDARELNIGAYVALGCRLLSEAK